MEALLWLVLLVPLLVGQLAQNRVRSVFEQYRGMANRARVTGAQVARTMLDAHGLRQVRVEVAPGFLSDHFDESASALRLSEPVAQEPSVASLGIAAHEVSHAYQAAEGNRWYRIRRAVGEPVAALAPWSALIFIGGFWFGVPFLIILSIAYVAALVLFAVATVPVEVGASRRALELLRATGVADPEELAGVRRVLGAAASTYVAGVIRQVGLLLALVLVAEATRQVMT